jgi:hypothetical protein
MQLKPYLSSLVKSTKENEDEQAPLRAKEMQKALELKSVQLESSIAKQQATIAKLTTGYPIDFNNLVRYLDELGLLERELAQLNLIGSQLFPQ